jgi:squalene synthase HpnC
MSVDHYENFPVGSLLLPKRLRKPITVIYHFARSADDIADEGDASPEERLAALEQYRQELCKIERGETPSLPLFQALTCVISNHALPLQPFFDLLSAFSQDVQQTRYADFQALLDYCQRSANPVGRLVLHLTGQATERNLKNSDHICTSLQLINFWQDVAIDWQKQRVYLPQNELALFDLSDNDIAAFASGQTCSPRWQDLMAFQTKRARKLMFAGAPLVANLPGRLCWEIGFTVKGGLKVLDKIDQYRGDVFRHRPQLNKRDWFSILVTELRNSLLRRRSPSRMITPRKPCCAPYRTEKHHDA